MTTRYFYLTTQMSLLVLKVYYHNFVGTPLPEKPAFDFIMGVLRISSKYYFHRASEWALGILRADWARTSPTWLGYLSNQTPPSDLTQNALKLILASRITGSTEFLPAAFYLLCVFDNWYTETPGGLALTRDDFIILLKGSRCLIHSWGCSRAQRQKRDDNSYPSYVSPQWWREFIGNNDTIATVLKAMGFT